MNNGTDWQRDILGDLVDEGYTLKEWADDAIELRYKDASLAAWHQLGADPVVIRQTALRHKAGMLGAVEVTR